MAKKKITWRFRVIKWLVRVFYIRMEVCGLENLPQEGAVVVGNHTQMNGPIACELYFPENSYTWCAAPMMHMKEVPAYAFQDFWSEKPRRSRWFYKIASYLIAPLSVCVFNNARTIGVYRDIKIVNTFKETVNRLKEGNHVVIFPECNEKYNNIIYNFQDRFIDVARLYYKKTGKRVDFVPLYIAPKLKKMYLGKPIRFCADTPIEQERRRICDYLMGEITDMARNLPEHTVVPYRNIPRRDYPSNKGGSC